jgi:hypothetical protein
LILGEEILVMPGAYDALSAKIIELVGLDKIRALEAHYLRVVFQPLPPQNK